jgi:hypothetical protein
MRRIYISLFVILALMALAYYLIGHCSWAIFGALYGAVATFLTYRLIAAGRRADRRGNEWET